MKRRFLIFSLVIVIVGCLIFAVACDRKAEVAPPDKTIVFLGDSIAEALIGPSPLSERDNYGYYALIGRTNNFKYYNHAVSGHKTSGSMFPMGGGFLDLLEREEESATLMKTHIKQADIIHISIGGNNLLQYNLGLLMMEVAKSDFVEKYKNGAKDGTTLINKLRHGGREKRTSLTTDKDGNHYEVEFDFPDAYQDICDIVSVLHEMNPNAKIFFQKVYNPVVGGSKFLYPELISALAEIDDDGRFGAAGTKIVTIEQVRLVAQTLLNCLNGMLDDYLVANPGSVTIIDANKAFDDYAKTDVRDGKVYYGTLSDSEGTCKGAELFFSDWTHPSNIGHAVLAATTQKVFEDMGLASANALDGYKQIKVEQVNRMYAGQALTTDASVKFDAGAVISDINSADSYQAVTDVYFAAIRGYLPKYC